jgi:hypothetical protein
LEDEVTEPAMNKRTILLSLLMASSAGFVACTQTTTEDEIESSEDGVHGRDVTEGDYKFERSVTCIHHRRERTKVNGAKLTRAWHLKIHGCLQGKLTVDPALAADKRIGVFSSETPKDVWMRITNINQPLDNVADLRGLALKVLDVPGAKKKSDDRYDGQDFLMNDTKVHFVNKPEDVIRATEITEGSKKSLKDSVLLFAMATRGKAQLTLPSTLLNHEYHSRAPFRLGDKHVIRYFVKTCTPTPDVSDVPAGTAPENRLTVDFQNRAKRGVCLDFMAQLRSERDSERWLDDLVTPWEDTPVKLATIQFPAQDPEDNQATCESLVFDPLHSIKEHEGVGIMNKGREYIYRASRAAASKRDELDRYDCTKIFRDFETRGASPTTEE